MSWSRRRGSKYGAIPVLINGIRFASTREGQYYWNLFLRQKAGKISKLELQPVFKFPMGFSYIGDFRYQENGKDIVEDVKGFKTPVFRLKEKCFRYFYPEIELRITK